MNTFATIEGFYTLEKVKYYTVRLTIEDEMNEFSETDNFFQKYNTPNHPYYEEFGTIFKLLKVMGQKGAKDIFFRFENNAHALPSKPNKNQAVKVMLHSKLRLYCVKLSENIVILCNGGVKTENAAQKCSNVSRHFRLANKIAKKIQEELKDGFIRINGKEFESNDCEIGFYI